MEQDNKLKLAVISGASHALKFLQENPRKTHTEAIQHVTEKVEEIMEKLDSTEKEN
jgi:hypothetical protein